MYKYNIYDMLQHGISQALVARAENWSIKFATSRYIACIYSVHRNSRRVVILALRNYMYKLQRERKKKLHMNTHRSVGIYSVDRVAIWDYFRRDLVTTCRPSRSSCLNVFCTKLKTNGTNNFFFFYPMIFAQTLIRYSCCSLTLVQLALNETNVIDGHRKEKKNKI